MVATDIAFQNTDFSLRKISFSTKEMENEIRDQMFVPESLQWHQLKVAQKQFPALDFDGPLIFTLKLCQKLHLILLSKLGNIKKNFTMLFLNCKSLKL